MDAIAKLVRRRELEKASGVKLGAKKKAAKKAAPKKKASPKKAAKKKASPKKKAGSKRDAFIRSQMRAGRSEAQAKAAWKLSRSAKKGKKKKAKKKGGKKKKAAHAPGAPRAPTSPRPPKAWMDACVASVEASGSAVDPAAVCGAEWYQKMSPAKKQAAKRAAYGGA